MVQYGLTAKYISKGEITGYFIVDSNGKQMLVSKEKLFELAEKNKIINWQVVTDEDGEKHLFSNDLTIDNIPNSVKDTSRIISILSRIYKEDSPVGFMCMDQNGDKKKLSNDKFWEYAKLGLVDGVTTEKSHGNRVIKSNNRMIQSLSRMDVK